MVRRQERVEDTRRRIAKATYELHSTIGPALATVALIADRAGLPRQTVYRNFGTQVELFRGCIAFGLELHPLPDPGRWQSISDRSRRLQVGLAELYQWFDAAEAVMTNTVRDMGVVQEAGQQAMEPVVAVFSAIYQMLLQGWDAPRVGPLLALALDFATWKKLRRESEMTAAAIVSMWIELILCRQAGPTASYPNSSPLDRMEGRPSSGS